MTSRTPSRSSASARFNRRERTATTDPYQDALNVVEYNVAHQGLSTADIRVAQELARLADPDDPHTQLCHVLLVLTVFLTSRAGSTRLDLLSESGRAYIAQLWQSWLDTKDHPSVELNVTTHNLMVVMYERITQAQHGLIGTDQDCQRPFCLIGHDLYTQRVLMSEIAIAHALKTLNRRLHRSSRFEATRASNDGYQLTNEQLEAVRSALTYPLTCVSGGPGTGKTSIAVGIVQGWLADGLAANEIMLAAPTGKAAWRMGDSLINALGQTVDLSEGQSLPKPMTIHRLLDYRPLTRDFGHHHNAPIPARGLIIDEASMIDTELAHRLLDALRPDARIVFLGDQNQLPSVGAGAVFAAMLDIMNGGVVHLTQSFRMRSDDPDGSRILEIANTICRGDGWPSSSIKQYNDPMDERWGIGGVDQLIIEDGAVEVFLHQWYRRYLLANDTQQHTLAQCWTVQASGFLTPSDHLDDLFDHYENQQLLAITHAGPTGVNRINRTLHAFHARIVGVSSHETYTVGDPCMILKNDDRNKVYNGDFGVILRVDFGAGPTHAFALRTSVGIRALSLDSISNAIDHAYAMTVHKAQGSEYARVGLMLPRMATQFLSRELVYTAITRARRSVTIVGQDDVIDGAISKVIVRSTGLRERFEELFA